MTESEGRARQKSQIQHIASIQEALDQVQHRVDEYLEGSGAQVRPGQEISATAEAVKGQIDELHALVLQLESYA